MRTAALVLYVAGVVIGLLRTDAGPMTRVVVALLWPVGLIAGVLTVGSLALAAMILFPTLGVATLLSAAAVIWWVS